MEKLNLFDTLILIAGIGIAFLGFKIISSLYVVEGQLSWSMIMTVFLWLILILVFIFMSIEIDVSRKSLKLMTEIKALIEKKKKP